jgi:hypothetical protein
MAKTPAKIVRDAKSGQFLPGTEVLGRTKDGVRILKPKGKATHFTQRELRAAVASVRAKRR